MNNYRFHPLRTIVLAGIASALTLVSRTEAHILFVDMDPVTPGIQGATAVLSGATVTAVVGIEGDLTPSDTPGAWDLIGLDLTWGGFAGSMATLTPAGAPVVGPIAGTAPSVEDFAIPGVPITPGTPLTTLGLMPQGFPAPVGGSLGGIGVLDVGSAPTFGGLGAAGSLSGPVPPRIDVFTISWTATGAIGDSVLIDPIGIMDSFGFVPAPGSPGAGFAALASASAGYTNNGGLPGTVTIVPEPASALLALLGLGFSMRRRRA